MEISNNSSNEKSINYESVSLDKVNVGDIIHYESKNWIVEKIKNDSLGLGIWVNCTQNGDCKWIFDSPVLRASVKDVTVVYSGAIDMTGVEHWNVDVYYISVDMWKDWIASGKPQYIGSILSNNVDGPGYYYLAGSTYENGYDVWLPAAKPITRHGQYIGQHIPELDVLTDVKLVLVKGEDVVLKVDIAESIVKADLIKGLRGGKYYTPECPEGYKLQLSYGFNGEQHCVDVTSKESI